MTIQTSGHVESVDRSGPIGMLAVRVHLAMATCREDIVFYIPEANAQYWLVGNIVQLTAHSYPQSQAPASSGEKK